jgi:Coiled stalk of trimeric autotransporter adhesin
MKYLAPIDLNQNELQNVVLQNLATDPATPLEGQIWQNTTSHHPKVRLNGSTIDLTDALTLGGNSAIYYTSRSNHTGTQTSATISDFTASVRSNTLNQMATPTSDLSLGSLKIINLANGTATNDAVNFGQLQSVINGTVWKDKVSAATTSNIVLTGEQTIDGVVTSGSRVLVKSQTVASQNGIYVSSVGAWVRSPDMASGSDGANVTVLVGQGTSQADTQWTCTSNTGSAVVGTNSLFFSQIGAATSYLADGSTLTLTGNTFSINSGYVGQTSITTLGTITTGTWSGTAIAVNKGGTGATTIIGARTNLGATGKYSALIGDGSSSSITITQATHGLSSDGTNMVSLYDASTGAQVYTNVNVVPANGNVILTFTVAPTTSQYRVVIIG